MVIFQTQYVTTIVMTNMTIKLLEVPCYTFNMEVIVLGMDMLFGD